MINRIKELRKERKISQEDLSKVMNVARSSISMYENGELDLSTDTLVKLSNYFNVSIDYILCRTDEKEINIVNARDIELMNDSNIKKLELFKDVDFKKLKKDHIRRLLDVINELTD